MRFGQAILSGYRNFADFSGRAGVDEYRHLVRFVQVASFGVAACGFYAVIQAQSRWMDAMSGLSKRLDFPYERSSIFMFLGAIVAAVFVLALPLWSCTVRRLHDTGRSGWHYVLPPLVALGVLAAVYAIFVPSGVTPVQAAALLFTPIWFYEPWLLVGLAAYAILVISLRLNLSRKLREPSQPGANRYGAQPGSAP